MTRSHLPSDVLTGPFRSTIQMTRSLLLLLAALLVPVRPSLSAERPNVVVILADDLGYADVGFHGCEDVQTPHLDRLAASGVRFASGYSTHPYCSPMRAGIMTGRYQHRFGYERNIAYDPQNNHMGLPEEERTIAARMKEAGYATGLFGKWHLGASRPFFPNRRGFDHFFGFLGGGHQYFDVDLTRPLGEGYYSALQRNETPQDLTQYLTTALSSAAARFIDSHAGEPFFLFVSYNAPHTPLQAPEERIRRFASIPDKRRRTYAAMVSVLDDGVGMILEKLDELALRKDTLVFFLSDNGGPEQANASRNDPLRGQKGDVFEGGIRVPFLASWPGTLPAAATYRSPVNSVDASCTALAVAGVDLDAMAHDGVNLVPYLTGENATEPHEALFWRMENGESWAVRSGSLKLLKTADADVAQLYDLAVDVGETKNLADSRREDAARLKTLYDQWNADNKPPFFVSFRDYHRLMDDAYRDMKEMSTAGRLP